jgi:hypothetical protein
MVLLCQVAADFTDEPCVALSGLGPSWSSTKKGKVTSVTVEGLVVTFNEVGLAAAGLGLVSITVGDAERGDRRKPFSCSSSGNTPESSSASFK